MVAAPLSFQNAAAQKTTDDSLTSICTGLLAETPGGVSGDHAKLCACLSKETASRLSQSEMMAYAQATVENTAPPDSVMTKIQAIATLCLQPSQ